MFRLDKPSEPLQELELPDHYRDWVYDVVEDARKEANKRSAADKGHEIHKDIEESLLAGRLPETDHGKQAWAFLQDAEVTIEAVEMIVWDPQSELAGQVDGVGRRSFEGKLVIWDWKSGKGPYDTHNIQLGAYAYMLEEMTGETVHDAHVVFLREDQYNHSIVKDLESAKDRFIRARFWQQSLKEDMWISGGMGKYMGLEMPF